MSDTRGLEGTGIFMWDDHHTEHLARLAAENGDTETEQLCDSVLAGVESEDRLIDVVATDTTYHIWMRRGAALGWKDRSR